MMKKRFPGVSIILFMLLFVFPFTAHAAVSIDVIPGKMPGDSVTLSGQTDLNEVSIKVIRPDDTILYVDVTDAVNGAYAKDFTLPGDTEPGTYTVVVGQGQDVATGTITVGGSGNQPPPVTPPPSEDNDTGNGGDNGNGGGGGGGSAPEPAGQIVTGSGGRITEHGVVIDIPAGAVGGQVRVTVKKVANISNLPLSKGQLVSQVFDINRDRTGNFSKPVTVTLPFDKSKADTGKYELKICWFDERTNAWIALDNIAVDLAAGKISGKTNHLTKFAVIATEFEIKVTEKTTETKAVILKDISGHWAENTIKQMVDRGVTKGYPDGSFKPDKNITRAEFAVFLVKAFNLAPKAGQIFKDTAGHWAKGDIVTAAANGIVGGYDAQRFGPNDLITREQMASMIVRAKKLPVTEGELSFADTPDISAWAKNTVATATKSGLLGGYPDNTVRPRGKATRAEAVTVIFNALQ